MKIQVLGSGPTEYITGKGKNRRLNSSILIDDKLLVDCTPFVEEQLKHHKNKIEAILISHAHADACLGLKKIKSFLKNATVPVYAFAHTIHLMKTIRVGEPEYVNYIEIKPNKMQNILGYDVTAIPAKHSVLQPKFDPVAVYAIDGVVWAEDIDQDYFVSDKANELKKIMSKAKVVFLDGAMCKGKLKGHMNIFDVMPHLQKNKIRNVFWIQIGRTCPAHDKLLQQVKQLSPTHNVAYDGMVLKLSKHKITQGVYLVQPYGEKFQKREITAFVKSKYYNLKNKYLFVCSGKNAYGIIKVNTIMQITPYEFAKLSCRHKIHNIQRKIWWGDRNLYYYEFETIKVFEQPIKYIEHNWRGKPFGQSNIIENVVLYDKNNS